MSGFLVILLGFASLALLGISPSCWVIFEHFSYDLGMKNAASHWKKAFKGTVSVEEFQGRLRLK